MKEEQVDETYPVGCLVEFNNINYEDREILIRLMSKEYSYLFQILFAVLEDDALTLKLIDIFSNTRIKFPPRKRIYKALEKIKIYTYAKRHNYSETSINVLAKQYKRRPSQIKSLINKINATLDKPYKESEDVSAVL